jgi:hypothetical protein
MRVGRFLTIGLVVTSFALVATAHEKTVAPAPPPATERVLPDLTIAAQPQPLSHGFFGHVDERVLANLLAPPPDRIPLTVVTGEATRCDDELCHVPLVVRLPEQSVGPVRLAFAVANSHGQLSDVQHADCGMGECTIDLILERGRNTISVGAVDAVAHTAGFATLSVNAQRTPVAVRGRTEWF